MSVPPLVTCITPGCAAVDGIWMRRKKPTLAGWIWSSEGVPESVYFFAAEVVKMNQDGRCKLCAGKWATKR